MFLSSDFIIMKLHTYFMKNYTCFKLQATSRSIDPQGCPFPWGSVQVLFCFWIPSPQVFEQVPTYSQIVHWQSTLHCNRYRIIQLYSCYRYNKNMKKPDIQSLNKAVRDLILLFHHHGYWAILLLCIIWREFCKSLGCNILNEFISVVADADAVAINKKISKYV